MHARVWGSGVNPGCLPPAVLGKAGWPVSPRDPVASVPPVLGSEVNTATTSVLAVGLG